MSEPTTVSRERFGSRLGFILISAGCAIGLGNVWRFPYITGQYGGAAFVVMYLIFLLLLGVPIMIMEFTVGRASQKGMARSFDTLEKKGSNFHRYKWVSLAGNYLLMMFYIVVAGWMVNYMLKTATGTFNGLSADEVAGVFGAMLSNPVEVVAWTFAVGIFALFVVSRGLQRGVERVSTFMVGALLVIMIALVIRAVTLPGASEGIKFYLVPNFSALFSNGFTGFNEVMYAAAGQAFFTLSLGIGSMAIFGSYIGKDRSITGEALSIAGLDTLIALMAGLIIFPACFAFGVDPGQGPGLIFITLSTVFSQMWMGQLWGTLFFLFMTFAALSSVIAVVENIIAFGGDQWHWSRVKSSVILGGLLLILTLPCALGYSVWSGVTFGSIGDIQSFEDFLLSYNILPIGSFIYVIFATRRFGWGWGNFKAEVDEGVGIKFPNWLRGWVTWGVPVLLIFVWVMGYVPYIQALLN